MPFLFASHVGKTLKTTDLKTGWYYKQDFQTKDNKMETWGWGEELLFTEMHNRLQSVFQKDLGRDLLGYFFICGVFF